MDHACLMRRNRNHTRFGDCQVESPSPASLQMPHIAHRRYGRRGYRFRLERISQLAVYGSGVVSVHVDRLTK